MSSIAPYLKPIGTQLFNATIVFHHQPETGLPNAAGPLRTREAGAYLSYVIARYDSLPDAVAFVHADAAEHNPMWTRWLSCLRPHIDFVSLIPVIVGPAAVARMLPARGRDGSPLSRASASVGIRGNPPNESTTTRARRLQQQIPPLAHRPFPSRLASMLLGASTRLGRPSVRGRPTCCLMYVQSAESIRSLPQVNLVGITTGRLPVGGLGAGVLLSSL